MNISEFGIEIVCGDENIIGDEWGYGLRPPELVEGWMMDDG